MKRLFARTVLPALALGTSLSGCAYIIDDVMDEVDGVPLAELDTSGSAPSEIRANGPDDVVITQGDSWSISVDGDQEAADALRFDLEGDRLKISRDKGIFDGRGTAVVRITMPAPSELTTAGSGSITADALASDAVIEIKGSGGITVSSVETDDLDIDIKGSGKVALSEVAADEFSIEMKGSGNVEAAGTAKRLEVDIKGNGNVMLEKLTADDVTIDIKGNGNVRLASDGKVHADIKGSGDIVVTGEATCTLDKKGSGSLSCEPAQQAAATEPGGAEAE